MVGPTSCPVPSSTEPMTSNMAAAPATPPGLTPVHCTNDVVENVGHKVGVTLNPDRLHYPRRVLLTGWMTHREFIAWSSDHSRALGWVEAAVAEERWIKALHDCLPGDGWSTPLPDSGHLVVEVFIRVSGRSLQAE